MDLSPLKTYILEDSEQANLIINRILMQKEINPIIGLDCEAALEMSRFGKLCLLQV